ncbi:MAG TPA: WcaF family extracellular polysaccharide biosynthesis acetyltransferase [Pedobacter sp.]|nr:WcaF family extracellular polysaccharide biosynthesis acetyltransferase [Pedobacter sp.]
MKTEQIKQTDLAQFSKGNYQAGPIFKVLLWYMVSWLIFDTAVPWPYRFKAMLLRCFGACVGKGLVIKPFVKIKSPWRLIIGDHCWIGESVWIDNLDHVEIGSHVCLSQAAMLLTGNHDYTQRTFGYRLGKIVLEDGVWIGARATVCPGIRCRSHAVLTVNSVASADLEPYFIYSGNPARALRERNINK